jgi:Baseplate J-like protein
MSTLPTVITDAGLQPQSPASLRSQLLASVAAVNPGYTANLPGSLIEDIASTDVGALVIVDSARVETVNSLTPFGANAFLLNQLGQIYGVQQGRNTNTSVNLVFSGTAGFVVPKGFTVSDGTHQYVVQDLAVIESGGATSPVFALATVPGTWAVPPNTVTTLVTSAPSGITLTCTNPLAGTPSTGDQSESDYRSQVLQAGRAASMGMPSYLKTLLGNVPGVQQRLVSVVQINGGGWEIIVGGGDEYAIAAAIYKAVFDVSRLTGSTINITGVTKANPGVYTTDLNHGLTTGDTATVAGSNPSSYNHSATVTVADEKTFSFTGFDTSGFSDYVSGGVLTPNARNVVVTLNDYPNAYNIPFVLPPQQAVSIAVTWNSTSTNVISPAAISSAAIPAIVDYINGIPVGQPINVFELETTFQVAVATLIPPALLTRMVFSVSINSVLTSPSMGTGVIAGDPESYFFALSSDITVTQG